MWETPNKELISTLPSAVKVHFLCPHADERGVLTEIHRNSWQQCSKLIQYNHVVSKPNALRGVHAHPTHTDYLYVSSGCMYLGLVDIRQHSASYMRSWSLRIHASDHIAITIAPGIAHGFYFSDAGSYIYGVDAYWDMADELACQWNDPQLKLDWPCSNPILSKNDQQAGTAVEMINNFERQHKAINQNA